MKKFLAFLTALTLLAGFAADVVFGTASAARAAPMTPVAPRSPADVTPPYHVVRPRETIKKIADFYGIKPAQLRAWNGIEKPNQPSVDAVLHLAKPPVPLTGWRSWIERVTPAQVGWDPAKGCPVLPANLRKVWVTYIDFYGVGHSGSIVVNKAIAARVQRIFLALYRMRFRIQGMAPMSINAPYITDMGTVTAAYNCRLVAGTSTVSQHAYGLGIDVNPVQNPMIRGSNIDPTQGPGFAMRTAYRRGMMHWGGATRAFTTNGLYWGGHWHSLKDYMHFSTTNK
ncbi:M15 family metallopeptidase [Actinoplanes sp. NPDC051494]|uniref:M15 family metallopeptidase n=1 Tax=Actinoplanes sp. NPDC051494 TaxID=3363907 RepID=UPI0037BCA594